MDMAAELERLQEELDSSKAECLRAAEAGMKLLQTNEELREQVQRDSQVYESQIEELQQEAHSLRMKLQIHMKTNEAFEEEIRLMKGEIEVSWNNKVSLIEQNNSAKVNQLNLHICELQNELTLREDQIERSRLMIREKEEEICRQRESVTTQANSSLLLGECSDLHHCKVALEKQCDSLHEQLERQSTAAIEANEERDICKSKICELEQLLKDRERLAYEWFQSLKETQEEVVVLRGRLDSEKIKNLQDDWQGQGNSLFGEVEDRRLQMEREMITIKVKYQSLQRTHHTLLQSYKKLKAEFTALLCRHGSVAADADHVRRLQRTLSQRNSEYEELNEKMNKLEKQSNHLTVSNSYANAFVEFGDKKEYIQYLEHEQKQIREELTTLKCELDLKSTQLIWECKKLSESEAKLHKSEKDKARMVNDACKMKLKLQEALDNQGNGKDCIKGLQKEIEILKQQLRGKIRSGGTFTTIEREEIKPTKKEEIQEKVHVEKKRQSRPTINLLEELQKANDDNSTRDSPLKRGKMVPTTTTTDVAAEGRVVTDNQTLLMVKSSCDECKENLELTLPQDKVEVEKSVEVRPIIRKTIKAADSKAKMDEQCRQQ